MLCNQLLKFFSKNTFRNYTSTNNQVNSINNKFFPIKRFNSIGNNSVDADDLLQIAIKCEKSDPLKAEELYKEIIYNVDPTRKEAYDKLIQLTGKKSVFGYTQEVDQLLERYSQYVKKGSPLNQYKPK